LAVKDNQPTLPAELQAAFVEAPAPKLRSSRGATTFAKGHGRYEQRTVQALPAREDLSAAQSALWAGVLTLVMVTRGGGAGDGRPEHGGAVFPQSSGASTASTFTPKALGHR